MRMSLLSEEPKIFLKAKSVLGLINVITLTSSGLSNGMQAIILNEWHVAILANFSLRHGFKPRHKCSGLSTYFFVRFSFEIVGLVAKQWESIALKLLILSRVLA